MNPTPSTHDFLAALWGEGPHAICWLEPDGRFDFFHVVTPDALTLDRMQSRDFWFGVHPLTGIPERGRGGATDVAEVHTLHADLDWTHPTRRTDDELPTERQVRDRLRKLGTELTPSAVIHSGHGLQAYWFLAFPVNPEQGQELQDRLTLALLNVGLDNGRRDIASIMRLPGTRNHKGEAVPVVIESLAMDSPGYLPEYLDKRLPIVPVTGLSHNGTRHHPGVVTDDQHAIANILVRDYEGHSPAVFRDGSIHLVRPGYPKGSSHFGASVIVGDEGDALLTVFTDKWPRLRKGSYVKDGDQLVHPSDPLRGITIVPGEAATSLPHPPDNLPDEFWNARPWLKSLREWAHSRMASADAVYGAVRARLSVLAPYNLTIDTSIGTPLSLNTLTGIVGEPGAGKTTAFRMARQVVALGREDIYEGPLGSGEGIAECFFEEVPEENPDTGKMVKVKRQTRNGALLTLDEGQALREMGSRGGSTLLPTIRSAWAGEMIGATNAAADTRRILAAGEYRMALVTGFQVSVAAEMFADDAEGTPHRFVVFNANDPSVPLDAPDAPLPDPIKTMPTITGPGHNYITVDMPIRREVRARHHAITTKAIKVAELDTHRQSNRLKEAALLALLDGRTEISEEDWELAQMVMVTSDEIRRRCIELASTRARRANLARGTSRGEYDAAAKTAKETHLVSVLATAMLAKLAENPEGMRERALRKATTAAHTKHRFDPALDLLRHRGQVEVVPMSDGTPIIRRLDLFPTPPEDGEPGEGE